MSSSFIQINYVFIGDIRDKQDQLLLQTEEFLLHTPIKEYQIIMEGELINNDNHDHLRNRSFNWSVWHRYSDFAKFNTALFDDPILKEIIEFDKNSESFLRLPPAYPYHMLPRILVGNDWIYTRAEALQNEFLLPMLAKVNNCGCTLPTFNLEQARLFWTHPKVINFFDIPQTGTVPTMTSLQKTQFTVEEFESLGARFKRLLDFLKQQVHRQRTDQLVYGKSGHDNPCCNIKEQRTEARKQATQAHTQRLVEEARECLVKMRQSALIDEEAMKHKEASLAALVNELQMNELEKPGKISNGVKHLLHKTRAEKKTITPTSEDLALDRQREGLKIQEQKLEQVSLTLKRFQDIGQAIQQTIAEEDIDKLSDRLDKATKRIDKANEDAQRL